MPAQVEQIEVDVELGALRSRLGKRGMVLRRSATRLVVRFEGETALTRIRPHLVRVITGMTAGSVEREAGDERTTSLPAAGRFNSG